MNLTNDERAAIVEIFRIATRRARWLRERERSKIGEAKAGKRGVLAGSETRFAPPCEENKP